VLQKSAKPQLSRELSITGFGDFLQDAPANMLIQLRNS